MFIPARRNISFDYYLLNTEYSLTANKNIAQDEDRNTTSKMFQRKIA